MATESIEESILSIPSTAGREAVEVVTNEMPIDSRFAEIAVREMAKIAAKKPNEPQ